MQVYGVMGHASKQMIYEVYGKYTEVLNRTSWEFFDTSAGTQNSGQKESPGRMRKNLRKPGLLARNHLMWL